MNQTSTKPKNRPKTKTRVAFDENIVSWDKGHFPADNYERLGASLAKVGDLYRCPGHANGILLQLDDGTYKRIEKGGDLYAVIIDRVKVRVLKDGNVTGSSIPAADLEAMLKAEAFLAKLRPVDTITKVPLYLPLDFELSRSGYNDGGPGNRILHVGGQPEVSSSIETISRFLDAMPFATNADRTNAVAAGLTVLLRNFWPGGKPIIVATATKSHSGKDTIIQFATGESQSISISYEGKNWPVERALLGAFKKAPDAAVFVLENARLESRETSIKSAIFERVATDPNPLLSSTKSLRRRNDFVLAISTNNASISEDIANRSLPIHLALKGNVSDRISTIGNPRAEFLPANAGTIASEFRGMIARWLAAGAPLDEEASHPFSVWAKTIGGILKMSGFADFLGNCKARRSADDVIRHGIGILGSTRPNEWLRPGEWAELAKNEGIIRRLIPSDYLDTNKSRERGVGAVLSSHVAESFVAETETCRMTLRLEFARRRWDPSGEPQKRYRFAVVEQELIPDEEQPPSEIREGSRPDAQFTGSLKGESARLLVATTASREDGGPSEAKKRKRRPR